MVFTVVIVAVVVTIVVVIAMFRAAEVVLGLAYTNPCGRVIRREAP